MTDRETKIEVTPEFEAIAVRLNGVLHLWLQTPVLAVQSWIMRGRRQYFIEFTLVGGTVTTDYDTREKWEAILRGLQNVLQGKIETPQGP